MEFVFVDFPTVRRVDRDGGPFGLTNRTLPCSPGHHTFDLATPLNYSPVSQNVNVTGTTPTMPLHVLFRPAATAFVAIASEKRARKRRKPARRKTAKKKTAAKSPRRGGKTK